MGGLYLIILRLYLLNNEYGRYEGINLLKHGGTSKLLHSCIGGGYNSDEGTNCCLKEQV